MLSLSRKVINLIHVLVVVPLLAYIGYLGYRGQSVPQYFYIVMMALAAYALVHHGLVLNKTM